MTQIKPDPTTTGAPSQGAPAPGHAAPPAELAPPTKGKSVKRLGDRIFRVCRPAPVR